MAGRSHLTVRPSIRFAGLAAVVLAIHLVALRWLGDALEAFPLLKPMAPPMFTRLLQPEAPRMEVAPAPKAAKKRTAIAAVQESAKPAKPAQRPASAPAPEQPADEAQAAASAPQAAASAVAAASAPASAASAAEAAASSPAATASLDSWPVDTRLSYRLTGFYRGDLTGSARVQWLRQEDHYEVRVDLDLGIFGMQFLSQGSVTPDWLEPRAYQETRPGRARGVQFAGDNVVLNDGRLVLKPAGVQDTASHFVELSHRFSTGKDQLVVGGHTSVWLARPGGVDLWTYDVVSLDQLATPNFGTVPAYHLKPRPIRDARGDIYVEIWLAPTLQYLPVRIRINQGTESYVDITVEKIEQR